MKRNLIFICLILLISSIAVWFFVFKQDSANTRVSTTAVITELKALNRLETAVFTVEKIVDAQTATEGRIQEFLFGDKLLLIAHGQVIAGIDLSKLDQSDIQIAEKNISITLPAAQILFVNIDNNKTSVYDRRTGLFSKGDKNLEAEARREAEQSIRLAACEGGILDVASENARKQLTVLFRTLQFESISITVPAITCQ